MGTGKLDIKLRWNRSDLSAVRQEAVRSAGREPALCRARAGETLVDYCVSRA